MLKKLLFRKYTGRSANLIWLFVLWCAIYVFAEWNYRSFHFIRPRGTPEHIFSGICSLSIWAILWFEFSSCFPSKHFIIRFLCGLGALIALMVALPTY